MPKELVRCPGCGAQNRVPSGRNVLQARCGQCRTEFSHWLDQPDAIRTAQQVNEHQPGPAKTASFNNQEGPAQNPSEPAGATRERLTSPAAIRSLLLAFALPLAVVTAVYHLFELGDPVGALFLIVLAAPLATLLPPSVRDSSGRFVFLLQKTLPVTGVASLAMSILFLMTEPHLTATAGDMLGHIAALPDEVARLLEPLPPPPEPEVVRSQLAVIDDMLDLLDD